MIIDKEYLDEMIREIDAVQTLIEKGLPKDVIRRDFAKAIHDLRNIDVAAAENE